MAAGAGCCTMGVCCADAATGAFLATVGRGFDSEFETTLCEVETAVVV